MILLITIPLAPVISLAWYLPAIKTRLNKISSGNNANDRQTI